MHEKVQQQQPLVPVLIQHAHGDELARMSAVLDELAGAVDFVHRDLIRAGTSLGRGRKGLSAEQVLRAMIIKQMNDFSYEELAFHLADSTSYRWFCRIGIADKAPDKSTLQKNIKRVRSETWEAVNKLLVQRAAKLGVESGQKVRTDCTSVESNIHHPTDSSLLWDCVRVLTRLMSAAHDEFGLLYSDHTLRAKRRACAIAQSKTGEQRLPLYRDLLDVADKTASQAPHIAEQLDRVESTDLMQMLRAQAIATELRHFAGLAQRVISQTERRVLRGESVPASEKLLSIFETHTNIIAKDNREAVFGHKVCLTAGASCLVTDIVVVEGNPADVTLAVNMMERQREIFGTAPRQASFDGGFASRANLDAIKKLGVRDVAFHKPCGLAITKMVRSTWVYRKLRHFRAGVEAVISFLKRSFGLARCSWRGFASFRAYVAGSVLACNLLVVARHLLARE